MNKVFYGMFISKAKNELKNIDHLLIRIDHKFLVEKSINEAIISLKNAEEYLIQAKKSYNSLYSIK